MVISSGCKFVLSHGTRVDMQIPASHSEEFPNSSFHRNNMTGNHSDEISINENVYICMPNNMLLLNYLYITQLVPFKG